MTLPGEPRPPIDLRQRQRQDERHLALWVVFFLVVVGGLVIGLVYGWGAAALGVACLLAGAGLFGLLWLIVGLLERWSRA